MFYLLNNLNSIHYLIYIGILLYYYTIRVLYTEQTCFKKKNYKYKEILFCIHYSL